jgi:hypothetical protein
MFSLNKIEQKKMRSVRKGKEYMSRSQTKEPLYFTSVGMNNVKPYHDKAHKVGAEGGGEGICLILQLNIPSALQLHIPQ